MKTQEILEGNKLIDLFNDNFLINNGWAYEEMNYHSDWNNLMPIVEKIYSIGNNSSLIAAMDFNEKPAYNNRKLAIWLAIVEFIKFYNEKGGAMKK